MDTAQRALLHQATEAKRQEDDLQNQNYSDFITTKHTEKHISAQVLAAQKVCRELDIADRPELELVYYSSDLKGATVPRLRDINYLWRELVINDRDAAQEALLRKMIMERLETIEEVTKGGSESDKQAAAQIEQGSDNEEEEDGDNDNENNAEYEAFVDMSPAEKLEKVTEYMRTTYNYCFWCGCRYESAGDLAENCPGNAEIYH